MTSIDTFLSHRVEPLVADQSAPIDLGAIAARCRILSVEDREMIPEAVMAPDGQGFRLYLQSNFVVLPGALVRRRFSFAHEIAHTFFFEERDGTMKPLRGAPTGDRLEAACHQGAALLLIPDRLLKRALKELSGPVTGAALGALATQFDVSVEAMVRRVANVNGFPDRFAPALVRRHHDGTQRIEYAIYPPWLKALVGTPRRGIEVTAWLGTGIQNGDGGWIKETPQGLLSANLVDIGSSLRILEIRIA